MSNATEHTDTPCPGSGRRTLHDQEPGIDEPWLGLCPVCQARLELGFAGTAPDHAAGRQRPAEAIDTTAAHNGRPAMVVSIEAGPFIDDGTSLTYAPHLLRTRRNTPRAPERAARVVWIDGAPFTDDGTSLVYAPTEPPADQQP